MNETDLNKLKQSYQYHVEQSQVYRERQKVAKDTYWFYCQDKADYHAMTAEVIFWEIWQHEHE